MSSMNAAAVENKFEPLLEQVREVIGFVQEAVYTGEATHEVERGLWRRLLAMGHELLGAFFALSGDGDEGERLTVAEGRELKRLAALSRW